MNYFILNKKKDKKYVIIVNLIYITFARTFINMRVSI